MGIPNIVSDLNVPIDIESDNFCSPSQRNDARGAGEFETEIIQTPVTATGIDKMALTFFLLNHRMGECQN